MRWTGSPSHLLYIRHSRTPYYFIFHFFGKKICQSVNYNKNGCKFAKRVNTKEAFRATYIQLLKIIQII